MATIPRTYLTTSKTGLASIPPRNGQVISVWDSDEVWYDAPANGQRDGQPIRRKISGVRIVENLPEDPMEGIIYVYVGPHGTLPETDEPIYDIRVWDDGQWKTVGNNWEDSFVESKVDDEGTFYLVGSPDSADSKGSLKKASDVFVQADVIHANLEGTASNATEAEHAARATLADKATNDNASTPKAITGYLYDVASDATTNLGSTITFTKGDGTNTSIRVSDTTYNVFTQSTEGLVKGWGESQASSASQAILLGSGWADISTVTMPTADEADKDSAGNVITATYVKDASYDVINHELTLVHGDNTTGTPISIPDTTYSVFTTNDDGLVPAASSPGDTDKFLKGDRTWADISASVPVYNGTDRTPGLVPSSTAGTGLKYLSDSGTWVGVASQDTNGLVPGPTSADGNKFLQYDIINDTAVWTDAPDTLNTTGSTNDTTNKLFVVGATVQDTSTETNTNQNVYIQNNRLYQYDSDHSQTAQVVDLTSTQNLTNKRYEGMELKSAASRAYANSVANASFDIFTGTGSQTTFVFTTGAINITSVVVNGSAVTSGYHLEAATNAIVFDTAPANNATIRVDYQSNLGDDLPTNNAVMIYVNSTVPAMISNSVVVPLALAPEYDSTVSYSVNDWCTYNDSDNYMLYRCISATTGTFDDQAWQSYTVIEAIKYLIANP